MSPKNLLLPAAVLIAVMAFLASHANAQTMGEYATTTAGVGTCSGSMGTDFKLPDLQHVLAREKGSGRPTKRERRAWEKFEE